ncbi:TPA: hypothetical protein ACIJR5_001966 [Klebsiella aerogenes]
MTTDITELAQREKFEAWWERTQHNGNPPRFGWSHWRDGEGYKVDDDDSELDGMWSAWKAAGAELVEALEKAQQRNAELEAQNDYFASLVAMARVSADKAIRKFPQPNYVLLKVAEEAGEVVQAGVHYAENRMEWGQVEGEIVQLLAMLIRLVTEGDQVNGITPPASCCAGIKVEADSLDADVSNRNQPGMVVAVHIDVGDFVKFRGRVYEVKETDFDDHDVTLWFVCGEVLKCAAGCPIEVVSAPVEDE